MKSLGGSTCRFSSTGQRPEQIKTVSKLQMKRMDVHHLASEHFRGPPIRSPRARSFGAGCCYAAEKSDSLAETEISQLINITQEKRVEGFEVAVYDSHVMKKLQPHAQVQGHIEALLE